MRSNQNTDANSPPNKITESAMVKIVVVGDERVGKTSISKRFCYGVFHENSQVTTQASCFKKNLFIDDEQTK